MREDFYMNQVFPEIDESAAKMIEIPNETGTPERRLLLAIIERAILDFVGNDAREAESAKAWIFGLQDDDSDSGFSDSEDDEDDEYTQFSFAWVCSHLDLDKKDIREKIRQMPKRGDSRLAPWYMNKAS